MTRTSHPEIAVLRACVFAASLAMAASPAAAQTAAGQSRTTVLDQITMTNTGELNFGRATVGATAGRIVINPNTNARTTTGSVVTVGAGHSRASFVVSGTPNRIVRFTVVSGSIVLSNGSGGTMTVNTFRLNGPRNRNLGAAGSVTLQVGARLNVNANQAPGNYTGSFQVRVDYF